MTPHSIHYQMQIQLTSIVKLCTLLEIPSRGRGRIPEFTQFYDQYILIVLDDAHSPVQARPLKEWHILELGVFEVGNFGKNVSFCYNVNFHATRERQINFRELKCKLRRQGIALWKVSRYIAPHFLSYELGSSNQAIIVNQSQKFIWRNYFTLFPYPQRVKTLNTSKYTSYRHIIPHSNRNHMKIFLMICMISSYEIKLRD